MSTEIKPKKIYPKEEEKDKIGMSTGLSSTNRGREIRWLLENLLSLHKLGKFYSESVM